MLKLLKSLEKFGEVEVVGKGVNLDAELQKDEDTRWVDLYIYVLHINITCLFIYLIDTIQYYNGNYIVAVHLKYLWF